MKLYHSTTSPYVRKVMAVLHIAGLADRTELIPGSGTPLKPNEETIGANPLGKVPCLVTDDGEALFDSRVITRYLADLGRAGLYPDDRIWRVLTVEALADGILDAALLAIYESRLRPEEIRFAPWVEGQKAKALRATAALDDRLDEDLTGALTIAHVAVGCALGYLDLRFPDLGWRERSPRLDDWYAGFATEPFMEATTPQV